MAQGPFRGGGTDRRFPHTAEAESIKARLETLRDNARIEEVRHSATPSAT